MAATKLSRNKLSQLPTLLVGPLLLAIPVFGVLFGVKSIADTDRSKLEFQRGLIRGSVKKRFLEVAKGQFGGLAADLSILSNSLGVDQIRVYSGPYEFDQIVRPYLGGATGTQCGPEPDHRKKVFNCVVESTSFYFDAEKRNRMVEIHWSYERNVGKALFHFLYPFAIAFSLVAAFWLFLKSYIRRRLLGPIERINEGIRRYAQSENAEEIEAIRGVTSFSEVQFLAESTVGHLRTLSEMKEEVKLQAVNKAIAQTTQMLAHDIRKPFSLVKSCFPILSSLSQSEESKRIIDILGKSLDKSLLDVESMIQDILELGSATTVNRQDHSLGGLVQDVLEEVAQAFPESDIPISAEFGHDHMMSIDRTKLKRTLSNIIGNAVQAITCDGDIWVKSAEANEMIEIRVGNKGSSIKEEHLDGLFDAFFTSGKKGGTGLGLAIAKQMVEAHGGEIRVTSSVEANTVEFIITLPVSTMLDTEKTPLVGKLSDYAIQQLLAADTRESDDNLALGAELREYLSRSHLEKVRIAILDDESCYRTAVADISRQAGLQDILDFQEFPDAHSFLSSDLSGFHVAICDVDLGHEELNGYDVVRELTRRSEFSGFICVCSNKTLSEDVRRAIEVGADAFQPKPMTGRHLIKMIVGN